MRSVSAMAGAVSLGIGVRTKGCAASAVKSSGPKRMPKKVFAHYMIIVVGYPPYPRNPAERVAAYKKDILHAQAKGIDGFVINTGAWDATHKAACDAMYRAAEELGTGFVLFFSIDYNLTTLFDTGGAKATGYAREIVTRYRDHPCQFKWDGKQVVSTFYGSQYSREFWAEEFIGPLGKEGVKLIFIPNFQRYEKFRERPPTEYIKGIYADYPFADGLFYFGGALVPQQMINVNRAHEEVAKELGKIYLAAVSPTYSPHGKSNNRLFDYRGGEGMARIWEGIIEDNSPWVEIVTWNDYAEQHYVGPSESDIDGAGPFPHLAYLELCAYYIDWFKTGAKPEIHEDEVLYFYRTHSRDATAPNAPLRKPDNWESVSDEIYVTAFLAAPATLEIHTGDEKESYALPAGMQMVSRPFREGTQEVIVRRGEKVSARSVGASKISNDIARYNFNYYSNFEVGDAWPDEKAGPKSWVLLQNHPNPFAEKTTIRFWAPKRAKAKLEVLDKDGKGVAVPLNGMAERGVNSVSFDGGELGPQVYQYRLTAGMHSEMNRMVILR